MIQQSSKGGAMEGDIDKRNFIIAEVLACTSFILNTICVITAERGGPFASAWVTNFGLIYWFKTLMATAGLFYFFTSRAFITREISRYMSILTLIILWYSMPLANAAFVLIAGTIFKAIQSSSASLQYEDRIPIQIIWAIPAFMIAINLLAKLPNIKKR